MTPEQRRKAMTSNRGRTGPERGLATALWRRGLRYLTDDGYKRRFGASLPGKPDIIFTRRRTLVFVDGCFWHGCLECGKSSAPMTDFWRSKIRENVERDRRVRQTLKAGGWAVVTVPEHSLRGKGRLEGTAEALANLILDNGSSPDVGGLFRVEQPCPSLTQSPS